jgi:hypothetical protein
MNYTERQQAEFREKFSKLQRRRKQANIVALASWVLIAISMGLKVNLDAPAGLMMLPVPMFFGAVIYTMYIWKCPACGTRLAQEKVKFCHGCGVTLAD